MPRRRIGWQRRCRLLGRLCHFLVHLRQVVVLLGRRLVVTNQCLAMLMEVGLCGLRANAGHAVLLGHLLVPVGLLLGFLRLLLVVVGDSLVIGGGFRRCDHLVDVHV